MLLVRDDLDANLACVLTKTLFDRLPQLEQVVGAAKGISLDTARDTDSGAAESRRRAGTQRPERREVACRLGERRSDPAP